MSGNEGRDSIEQAVANLQREVLAMRQILTLLLAHHTMRSAVPNALGGLKDLLDEVTPSSCARLALANSRLPNSATCSL